MCGLAAPSLTSLERERGYGGAAAPRGEAGLSDRDEEHQQLRPESSRGVFVVSFQTTTVCARTPYLGKFGSTVKRPVILSFFLVRAAQWSLGRLPARREPPAMGARARAKHLPLRLPYLLVRLVFGQNVTSTI